MMMQEFRRHRESKPQRVRQTRLAYKMWSTCRRGRADPPFAETAKATRVVLRVKDAPRARLQAETVFPGDSVHGQTKRPPSQKAAATRICPFLRI